MNTIDWLEHDDEQRDWGDAPEPPLTQREAATGARLVVRPRFQHDIEAICRRGTGAVGELVAELGARHGDIENVERVVHRCARRRAIFVAEKPNPFS